MQRLTILIAITLGLASQISADDDILLDRDVFYWKPAGPDIEIPDIFFHPELFSYDSALFKDDFIVPDLALLLAEAPEKVTLLQAETPEKDKGEAPDITHPIPDWTPPALNLLNPLREGDFVLNSFYPYGFGAAFRSWMDPVSWEVASNYDPRNHYPIWLLGSVKWDQKYQSIKGRAAWRHFETNQLLSLWDWSGSTGYSHWGIDGGLQFRNVLDSSESSDHNWAVRAFVSTELTTPFMMITTAMGGEYLAPQQDDSWRVTPAIRGAETAALTAGDLSLSGGAAADLYLEDFKIRYYPELKIQFRDHGTFSVFIETSGYSPDEENRFRFLLDEPCLNPDIHYIHWQKSRGGVHFTRSGFQGYTAAGLNQGEMPVVSDHLLSTEDMVLLFAEMDLSWQIFNGNVMEINSYADYEDRESFRYLGIVRMVLKGLKAFSSCSFDVHSGNRELVRGYRDFFFRDSDMLYGTGFGVVFSRSLKLRSSLDYAYPSLRIEGGVSLSYTY